VSGRLTIGDVRLIVADIPVSRPHHMSFTTLTAVNFVFVRIETREGLVGWGEAACLGGPTWSEESAESIAATLERYLIPWLVGRDAAQLEAVRLEMARRVQGNPFARAAVEMALWDLNGRALGVPVHRLLGGRVRDRVPLSWSLAVSSGDAELAAISPHVAVSLATSVVLLASMAWDARQRRPAPPRDITADTPTDVAAGQGPPG
jgi:muconate cycloisomerase